MNPITLREAQTKVDRAVMSLIRTEPFFATILLRLERKPVGKEICEIAAVDGKSLFYNPDGIVELSHDVTRTVLVHETLHIAMQHHVRMVGKDPELSNVAADHVINLILKDGDYTPWDGWLCDERFKGQAFEQVYAKLLSEQMKQDGGGGQQPPPQQQQQAPQQGGQSGQQQPQAQTPPGGVGNQQQPAGGNASNQAGQNGQPQQPQGQQPGQQAGGNASNQQGQPQPAQGQPQNGQGGPAPPAPSTPGGIGQIMPCPADEVQQQEAEWKMVVEQAAIAAEAAGNLPGHLRRLVEELREARVDWKEILKAFVAEQIPADWTWSRPNRRLISEGLYLPSVKKEGLADLAFFIDMSGSCGRYIPPFSSEVKEVHAEHKPTKLTLYTFDTRVHLIGEFTPDEEIVFDLKGGGGTDFRPIFKTVEQLEPKPKAVVILTDLYGPLPKYEPDGVAVLWVCTNRQVAPFGETVKMEI